MNSAHPLAAVLQSVPGAAADTRLGRDMAAAPDLSARAVSLHSAMLRPLLDSYNVLTTQLQALPKKCFSPQSLETLRLVMLPCADQYNGNDPRQSVDR